MKSRTKYSYFVIKSPSFWLENLVVMHQMMMVFVEWLDGLGSPHLLFQLT